MENKGVQEQADFHKTELKMKMIYSGDFVDSFIHAKELILMDYTHVYFSPNIKYDIII